MKIKQVTPAEQTVARPAKLVRQPQSDPARVGYKHSGWDWGKNFCRYVQIKKN